MKYYRSHPHLTLLIICLASLAVFLTMTNPNQVTVGFLVVPVVLMFLAVFLIMQIFLPWLGFMKGNRRKERVSAMAGASLVTVLLILQSTGGISGIDVILLALLIVIASLYISKY